TGLPGGLTINPSGLISGRVSYSAAETNGGIYNVTVSATDTHGAKDTKGFSWTVTDTNQPPTLSNNGAVSVDEGATAIDTGAFSDPDSDNTVSLSASVGTVTGGGSNNGTWSWSFATTDGPTDSQTVTITA